MVWDIGLKTNHWEFGWPGLRDKIPDAIFAQRFSERSFFFIII